MNRLRTVSALVDETTRFPAQYNTIRFIRKRRMLKLPPPNIAKRLDCVIFGMPNVGKSVILNAMIKQKLAATCRKRHTTRGEILGVFNHRNTQLVFYDTPGYIGQSDSLKNELKLMRELASSSLQKADVVLLVVDAARKLSEKNIYVFSEMAKLAIRNAEKEVILVLNKVDLVEPKTRLLDTARELVSILNGIRLGTEKAHLATLDTATFMISALHNDGLLDLKNYLIRSAEQKEWLLPASEKAITTLSHEERVEEIILEKLLDHTHDEIPYIAKVHCVEITELSPKLLKIEVEIIVDSGRQVKIVVGHQGRTLVKIRQSAVEELEQIFERTIVVRLYVKTRKEGVNHQSLTPTIPTTLEL